MPGGYFNTSHPERQKYFITFSLYESVYIAKQGCGFTFFVIPKSGVSGSLSDFSDSELPVIAGDGCSGSSGFSGSSGVGSGVEFFCLCGGWYGGIVKTEKKKKGLFLNIVKMINYCYNRNEN